MSSGLNFFTNEIDKTPVTLSENYTTGDDGDRSIYGVYWSAQTFTPGTTHTVTILRLKLLRVEGSPGTVTVSIRATNGSGHPTGSDLASGTYNGNSIPLSATWIVITLGAGYSLSAGTKYAIVVRATAGNSLNSIAWREDSTSATYTGGNGENSSDSGASWVSEATWDFMFEEYSGAIGAWADVNVLGNGVPAGATGVILRLHNTDAAAQNLAVRKNGSTDTRTPQIGTARHTGAMVGIDANRIFETYIGSPLAKVYLIGYTTDSTDFLTNSRNKTPAIAGSYQTVSDTDGDIPAGATGVIVEFGASAAAQAGGVRAPGSTDDFYARHDSGLHFYQVCGVNADGQYEAMVAHATDTQMWLIGYFMTPVTFETNAISKALAIAGSWQTITYSEAPADADGALLMIAGDVANNHYDGGVRKPTSTDSSFGEIRGTTTPAVRTAYSFFSGMNASRQAEGYVENLAVDHYVSGYAKPAAAAGAGLTWAIWI